MYCIHFKYISYEEIRGDIIKKIVESQSRAQKADPDTLFMSELK